VQKEVHHAQEIGQRLLLDTTKLIVNVRRTLGVRAAQALQCFYEKAACTGSRIKYDI
jgi:hypothetical protein